MKNKIELLAPAGNYNALTGAIHAGADAVYLGGNKFGARAFADNFTEEQICEGIRFAHLFQKKIYLTVNTLMKGQEISELSDFIRPFYHLSLDGVIVQDLGALVYLAKNFPNLPLHASTQMTITDCYSVELLKKYGVSRVVPARELSLEEMKHIMQKTGIEIEAFIHGAMCYSYSGQCLFSSILGGRSGNRGRCAQPCRLPYTLDNPASSTDYPLSMKDMCTIHLLPELIDAGISSLKIEGRMKKPEYSAGVTSIYRKYIDLYDTLLSEHNISAYRVSKEDLSYLNSIYIRSERCDGYYHKTNGRDMITLHSSAYSAADQHILADIEERYIRQTPRIKVHAEVRIKHDEAAFLHIYNEQNDITYYGNIVDEARKQPLTTAKITEQIEKSGDSHIQFERILVDTDDNSFLPLSQLNDLRRNAIHLFEEKLSRQQDYVPIVPNATSFSAFKSVRPDITPDFHVYVRTMEQLKQLSTIPEIRRIYIDYTLLSELDKNSFLKQTSFSNKSLFVAGPYIIRKHTEHFLQEISDFLEKYSIKGVLFRNLETYAWFLKHKPSVQLIPDHNLYLWNKESVSFFSPEISEVYLPIELNEKEWKHLIAQMDSSMQTSAVIYGRIPMMLSANCLMKTYQQCRKTSGINYIKDRYQVSFPVLHNCTSCYNVVYNSVPISLHALYKHHTNVINHFRLDFITESGTEADTVIRYFLSLPVSYCEPPYEKYTTGHLKRGVE